MTDFSTVILGFKYMLESEDPERVKRLLKIITFVVIGSLFGSFLLPWAVARAFSIIMVFCGSFTMGMMSTIEYEIEKKKEKTDYIG